MVHWVVVGSESNIDMSCLVYLFGNTWAEEAPVIDMLCTWKYSNKAAVREGSHYGNESFIYEIEDWVEQKIISTGSTVHRIPWPNRTGSSGTSVTERLISASFLFCDQ